jgi:hypothetical protein
MRLLTKDQRNAAREYQFRLLIAQGYSREKYGKREIFTKNEEPRNFFLKSWFGNAARPDIDIVYRDRQNRDNRVVALKKSADEHEEFKRKCLTQRTEAAECAMKIKQELKSKFPGVDFSVRSENYTGGDAVRIAWLDGPTEAQVDNVVGKFKEGHFDGMNDIYEYSNRREDIPQVKYITKSRGMSQETRAALMPDAELIFQIWGNSDGCWNVGNLLHRIFCQWPLPAGAVAVGIKKTNATCGNLHDFFKIDYK